MVYFSIALTRELNVKIKRNIGQHRKNRKEFSGKIIGNCSSCAAIHCNFNVTSTAKLPHHEGNYGAVSWLSCLTIRQAGKDPEIDRVTNWADFRAHLREHQEV